MILFNNAKPERPKKPLITAFNPTGKQKKQQLPLECTEVYSSLWVTVCQSTRHHTGGDYSLLKSSYEELDKLRICWLD